MRKTKLALLTATGVLALGAGPAQAEITIAVVGPMTGQYATFGEQMRRGAEMAVADLNRAGGVLGEEVTLLVGDDACDPRQAVSVANQMVNDDVVFVAGHWCSGSSIPASQVYTEEGILQISPGSTNPALTDEGGDNVFRVCGRDDQQGAVAGDYLMEHFSDQSVAFVHDRTAYGKGLADQTLARFQERGGEEVLYEAYTAGESDYTALVSKLKQLDANVLYVGGYHTEAGLMVRQMREQGMDTQLVSGDALVTDEFWAITGAAGEGTLFSFSPDPRKNDVAAEVVERFLADGYDPEGYTLYTYGAVQAWAQAAEQAGTLELDPVIEQLWASEFSTVLGTIGFDEKGDVSAPGYVFYRWSNGAYDYAEPEAL